MVWSCLWIEDTNLADSATVNDIYVDKIRLDQVPAARTD